MYKLDNFYKNCPQFGKDIIKSKGSFFMKQTVYDIRLGAVQVTKVRWLDLKIGSHLVLLILQVNQANSYNGSIMLAPHTLLQALLSVVARALKSPSSYDPLLRYWHANPPTAQQLLYIYVDTQNLCIIR